MSMYDRLVALGHDRTLPNPKMYSERAWDTLMTLDGGKVKEEGPSLQYEDVETFWDTIAGEGNTILRADVAAEYYWQKFFDKGVSDPFAELHNIAPPFTSYFTECKRPKVIEEYVKDGAQKLTLIPEYWGVQTLHIDPKELHRWSDCRFVTMSVLYCEWEKWHPVGPVAFCFLGADEDGRPIVIQKNEPRILETGEAARYFYFPVENDLGEMVKGSRLDSIFLCLIESALVGTTFLHCKNVETEDVEPHKGQSRTFRKKHGQPLRKYKVLSIDPNRRGHNTGGARAVTTEGKALHRVRGHFKTYKEDAPLLGRHVGQYFWADQLRGAKDEGEIVKDYELSDKPQEEAS